MSEVKHSPTPWTIYPLDAGTQTRQNFIRRLGIRTGKTTENFISFSECTHVAASPEQHANARFVLRAVNAHDELLAALKELRAVIQRTPTGMLMLISGKPEELAVTAADAAIAKAEGK